MGNSTVMLLGAFGALALACSSRTAESVADGAAAATEDAQADWSQFPDYQQCLVGVQLFYPARFNAHVPGARNSWTGTCGYEGACHIWIDDIPDSNVWQRIPNDGSERPSTYDLIVFPETSSNPWGHIASVDHVDGNGDVYVMDDNYNSDERRAWKPHTVWRAAYGWYHLRALPKDGGTPPPQSHGGACPNNGLYCGGDYIQGDANTLYRCSNHSLSVVQSCSGGCQVNSNGVDDACKAAPPPPQSTWCPNDGLYCGGDYIQGDANTLYRCSSHSLAPQSYCASGCQVQPDGSDDYCR